MNEITQDNVEVLVYGTAVICASCVNAPSSEETASWLQSLFDRKYGDNIIKVKYIDFQKPENEQDKLFARKIILENLWYPVVVINGEIITEGNPNLKVIFNKLKELGIN